MPATFLHNGAYLDHIPAADLPAGAVVVIADSIGIATRPIPAGALGTLAMDGVFEIPRAPGPAVAQGRRLVWDPAAQHATPNLAAPGAVLLGIAAAAAPEAATTIRVRLNH